MGSTFGEWIAEKQRENGLDGDGKPIPELKDGSEYVLRVRLRRGRNVHAVRAGRHGARLAACGWMITQSDHLLPNGQKVTCSTCLRYLGPDWEAANG